MNPDDSNSKLPIKFMKTLKFFVVFDALQDQNFNIGCRNELPSFVVFRRLYHEYFKYYYIN